MTLTRADLENHRLRRLFRQANPGAKVLSDDELEASLQGLLAQHQAGEDVWLFGYGSLIWNPIIHSEERRVARLHGYHRRFCLWSLVGRGSPARPGLVLGLDLGGCCHGVAFRIDAAHAASELRLLWRREMVVGSYSPRWVKVASPGGEVRAIAFIVNRGHPHYAGRLPLQTVLTNMVSARGYLGTPAEYLIETIHGLLEHGVRDKYLIDLKNRVLAAQPGLARVR